MIKSFRTAKSLYCISACLNNSKCSIAIFDASICNIFKKVQITDSNTIFSSGSTLYVKNGYQIEDYLIHYWPFNGNYFDIVSNAHLFNGYNDELVTDRFGRTSSALYLNYGSLQAPTLTYFYGDFTLTTWVKMQTLEPFRRFFYLSQEDATEIYFSFNEYTGPYYVSKDGDQVANTSLITGEWQHLAFTIREATLSIYIDGVVVYEAPTTPIKPLTSTTALFGFDGNTYTAAVFDDIKIYNISLTESEIIQSSLFNL